MMAPYGTTLLVIQGNADEAVCNAVLWYESDLQGRGREVGKIVVKTTFSYCHTEPTLQSLFLKSESLVNFIKVKVDSRVVRAILYSKLGWDDRNRIKKKLEKDVESFTLCLCCTTCGCAVLCCGLCGAYDQKSSNVNEDYYCEKMTEENPKNKTAELAYDFEASSATQNASAPIVMAR